MNDDLTNIIIWWNKNYWQVSDDEGWYLSQTFGILHRRYFNRKPFDEIRNSAKKWGWLFNDDFKVIGFDEDVFNKVKHLISAKDLGLI